MLDSINRPGQANIDWSQLVGTKKTTTTENDFALISSQSQKDQQGLLDYDKNKLNKEMEKINAQLAALNHSLRMKFSEEAEQFYVEVIDVRTKEVLDSIPGKHMIELAAKLKDMIGFFIDEKR